MKRSAYLLLVAFLCTILQPRNGFSQTLVGGPIAHWKLDSPPGSDFAEDATGNFRGTVSPTGADFVPGGITGNAISITRAGNGHVDMGDVLALTNINFTISVWVKSQPGDQTPESVFVSRHVELINNGYFLGDNRHTILIGQPGKALLFAGGTNAAPTSTTSVNDGNWHHVVGVHLLSGTQLIYVDGQLESTVFVTTGMIPSTADFFLGAVESDTGLPESRYNGLLDEVQIYDRALSAAEIAFLSRNPGLVVDNTAGNTDFDFDPLAGFANVGVQPVVINEIVPLSTGSLLVGGSFATYQGISAPNFARILPNATLDTNFFHGFGASARVNDFVVQSDNKIVVVGGFDAFHEVFSYRIARITENGHPDRSFRPGGGADLEIQAVALQANGGIVVGGNFNTYDNTNRARIARLFNNGKLDSSFDPGTGFDGTIFDVVVLSNGQILAAGNFTTYNGFTVSGLVRLNSDGSIDSGFTAPFEPAAIVNEIMLDPDGKIVAVGDFDLTGVNGRRNVARLNADGTLDVGFGSNSFSAGGNGSVHAVARCSDGTYIVGGDFGEFDGVVRSRLAKLSTNGLLDNPPLFLSVPQLVTNTVVSTNMVTVVSSNAPAPSTNIFFGYISNAMFVTLTTNTPPTAAQTTFVATNQVTTSVNVISGQNPEANYFGLLGGVNGSVQEIVLTGDGEPVIGGAFTMVSGLTRNGLARLSRCVPQVVTNAPPPTPGSIIGVVTDATTGAPLGGTSISNMFGGTISAADGSYTLSSAVVGTNLLLFTRAGYATVTNSVTVNSPLIPSVSTVSMSPVITDTNTIRLVLTWGGEPRDLDSHLDVPVIPTQTVNFINRGTLLTIPFANLDVDDVDGFGPETITITNLLGGIYNYYIHRFSGASGFTFTNSMAEVRIFDHTGLIGTINVRTNDIIGDYWHVLQIDGANRTFAVVNAVSNGIPTVSTNVTYAGSIGGGISSGPGASIGPPGPPRIDTQPNDQFEPVGGTALLSAGVSGSLPFSFQWYHNGDALVGETGASLTMANMAVSNAGDYHLIITNPLGRATSVVAQVAVLSPTAPFVFLQPENVAVDIGGTASFEVIAGGARPLFYQWRHDGLVVPNIGGPLLTITNVQTTNEGEYQITVANSFGTVFSKEVSLSVATPPVITNFTFDPGAQVSAGTTLSMSVGASGKGPFDYRWYFNGALIPTAVTSNLTFQSVHFANGGDYSVIVSNVLGSATNGPNTLTVNSLPIITQEPQNEFQTIGRSTTLSVTAIGTATITYQWRKDGLNLPGETSNQLVFTNIQSSDVGLYSVVVANGIGAVTSRLARVDVVLERALLPWVTGYGGTDADVGESVAVDSNGNVFVCGRFAGTAQFGTNSLVSAGLDDIFIARLDGSGNTIWAKRIGGAGFDVAKDITTDSNGDILVTGSFEGTVDFGGTTLTNANATSFGDLFLARFTSDGTLTWARRDGMPFVSDIGNCVTVDATQNAYVAGHSTLDTFGGTTVTNHGRILLAKYDSLGNRVWARKAGGGMSAAQDAGESVAIDSSGNVFLGGTFHSSVFTNDATGLIGRGFADGFISKYDANGTPQWTRQIGGTGADSASGIATVGGNAVVVGQFSATNVVGGVSLVSEGGILTDGYVINYDAAGNVVWAKRLGGSGADAVRDVATDASGAVYITGFFQGTATFGNRTSISIAGTTDIFAARLRNDGTFEFVQQAGGDDISGEFGNGIAVDSFGNGVFTGSFRGTLVAGGSSLVSSGSDDVFVSRLVSPPALTIDVTGSQLIFSWPSFWTGFGVQVNDQFLRSANWQNISLSNSNLVGNRIFITNTATTNIQFFRLLRP